MTTSPSVSNAETSDVAQSGSGIRRLGLAMAIYALSIVICTAALAVLVGYPGIVDSPAGDALSVFNEHRTLAIVFFYLFAAAGLLFSIIALAVPRPLGASRSTFTAVFISAGAVSGLLRCMGALRWCLVAPKLSAQYVDPASSPAAKEAARTGWLVVNAVLGDLAGDMLGFGLSALFLAGIAHTLNRTGQVGRAWTRTAQILSVYGLLEFATFVLPENLAAVADILFPLSYILSILWLGITGLRLYLRRHPRPVREIAPRTQRAKSANR